MALPPTANEQSRNRQIARPLPRTLQESSTPAGIPAARSCLIVSRRASGEDVRGSSTRRNFGSSDVTEMFTATALQPASSRKRSISRVTRRFLGNDRHRITKFGQHFETTARDTQLFLNRLIRIGHAAHHERLRFPTRRLQFHAQ